MPNETKKSVGDDRIQQFTAVTGTDEDTARHFLDACGGDLNTAIGMHMDSTNGSIAGPSNAPSATNGTKKRKKGHSLVDPKVSTPVEKDSDPVRAPIPQRTEVLAPNRIVYSGRHGKRRKVQSVFDQFRDFQTETMRSHDLVHHRGPGGSSRRTLQELFRPPIELIHKGSFHSARQAAVTANRWLIATIHNVTEFQCQVLNRDVWSNPAVQELVRQRFIFWQAYSDSEDGRRYMVLYGVTDWPYVAIIDPRTGEKMISWQKIEANTFREIASQFLELHPAPGNSERDSQPMKRPRTEAATESIVDASEDNQLTAALAASIQENSYRQTETTTANTSDDESNHLYSSDSDLETFSDSDGGQPTSCHEKSGHTSQAQQRFSIDDTIVSMPQADNGKMTSELSVSSTNENVADNIGQEEQWRNFLGKDSDPTTTVVFRCPNNLRNLLSLPNSSSLMALVSYMSSLGYSQDRYELVTSFPKRHISRLDLNSTLVDSGINPQETLYIQEI